jgi:Domain of unknown function (DUF5069)
MSCVSGGIFPTTICKNAARQPFSCNQNCLMSATIPYTDLTQRPPRSPRSRLGGFAILPRMIDKGRATLAKRNGEYIYHSPTDRHLVRFLGFDAAAMLKELADGKGDGEILA